MLNSKQTPDGVIFEVRVQPRASRDAIAGLHDGALKVRLCAPPVEGAANQALLKLLSKTLKLPKADLELAGGQKSRSKRIKARVLDSKELRRRLKL